jgi:hypothetical protein
MANVAVFVYGSGETKRHGISTLLLYVAELRQARSPTHDDVQHTQGSIMPTIGTISTCGIYNITII